MAKRSIFFSDDKSHTECSYWIIMQSSFIFQRRQNDNFGFLIVILRIKVYHSSVSVENNLSSLSSGPTYFVFKVLHILLTF